MTPVCPYCEVPAVLVDGKKIYPHRPDLAARKFWLCGPCDAYVGCHVRGAWSWRDGVRVTSDGTLPLGRLADAELRAAKSAVHAELDKLWPGGGMTRGRAYALLAKAMGMNKDQCHVGLFDLEQCHKAAGEATKLRLKTMITREDGQ